MAYVESIKLLTPAQFGFRHDKNTENTLQIFVGDIHESLNMDKCAAGKFLGKKKLSILQTDMYCCKSLNIMV